MVNLFQPRAEFYVVDAEGNNVGAFLATLKERRYSPDKFDDQFVILPTDKGFDLAKDLAHVGSLRRSLDAANAEVHRLKVRNADLVKIIRNAGEGLVASADQIESGP